MSYAEVLEHDQPLEAFPAGLLNFIIMCMGGHDNNVRACVCVRAV